MGKKVILLTIIIAGISAFVGERVVNLRKKLLANRELKQNHLPNCRYIKGLDYGSEDITILPGGLAFISTGLKVPGFQTADGPGKIYILDMEEERMKPVELRMGRGFQIDSFNPHGISTYTDDGGAIYLFVVNHPQDESQVEIFKFLDEENSLVYLKTIKHELLISVNDIVAVGPESFYATNDNYFKLQADGYFNEILNMLGMWLSLPWCTVVYYSPEEVKVVSDSFYMANGINVSPDKKHMYVADFLDSKVHVMEIQESKDLMPVKSVDIGTLPDNIEVDPQTGDVWVGCHPNGWKIFFNTPQDDPAGSEVIRIENILSEQPSVQQVYMDDGSVLIGSSVAAHYGGKLLIGSVFHRTLYCDL
ncbi:serum paraoxonase/arylesterase 2-like [Engraulis encrasicolus]|uniref:serum paraoxonase/arylesterase 2-like n=1 Tax=Engraulis encrasicolus TaxID=184585 RepID=UPI002FD449F9